MYIYMCIYVYVIPTKCTQPIVEYRSCLTCLVSFLKNVSFASKPKVFAQIRDANFSLVSVQPVNNVVLFIRYITQCFLEVWYHKICSLFHIPWRRCREGGGVFCGAKCLITYWNSKWLQAQGNSSYSPQGGTTGE